MNIQEMFFALVAMHFLCDYPLQGDFIGKFKNRHNSDPMRPPIIPWWHLMTAHAFIQGGGVFLLTGSVLLGLVEVIAHFLIDVMKCENWTNIHTDQALHILFKLLYVLVLISTGWIR